MSVCAGGAVAKPCQRNVAASRDGRAQALRLCDGAGESAGALRVQLRFKEGQHVTGGRMQSAGAHECVQIPGADEPVLAVMPLKEAGLLLFRE